MKENIQIPLIAQTHEAFSMFQSQIQSNGKTVNNSELSNLVWAVTGGCDLVW